MYVRSQTVVEISPNSDMSRASTSAHVKAYTTTTEKDLDRDFLAALAGTAFPLSLYTTVQELVFQNLDATNFVTLAWTTATAAGAVSMKVLAGQCVKLVDVQAAAGLTVTANTAPVNVRVTVFGV